MLEQFFQLAQTPAGAVYVICAFALIFVFQLLLAKNNKQKYNPQYLLQMLWAAAPIVAIGIPYVKPDAAWITGAAVAVLASVAGLGTGMLVGKGWEAVIEQTADPRTRFEVNLGKSLGKVGVQLDADEVAREAKDLLMKLGIH